MIPLVFCGKDFRDWPRWMFWKRGHREHEYMGEMEGTRGRFPQLMVCPGEQVGE